MKKALVDSNGMIVNVIVADDNYKPPAGLTLQDVNMWLNKGDRTDKAKPAEKVMTSQESKDLRNKHLQGDLSLKYLFNLEKAKNPTLTFSAFLDAVESLNVS